ncbi:MAG: NAD(P)(+) transhydrogenase (Re/Si-specific) subunit beta [Myxococcota bacterium]
MLINVNTWASVLHGALLVAGVGFVLCLKLLASPRTARQGNAIGALAMLLACGATLAQAQPDVGAIRAMLVAAAAGAVVGVITGRRVHMTAMPQLVAVFNGLGGAASVFVAGGELVRWGGHAGGALQLNPIGEIGPALALSAWAGAWVGGLTFSGSLIAFGKLQGLLSSQPVCIPKGRIAVCLTLLLLLGAGGAMVIAPKSLLLFGIVVVIAEILGILLTLPIGGADMPVVISLLNAYSGLAALACGFVVNSPLLILSGSLVGASGIILTRLMCQAMNRSLANVVFGAFGAATQQTSGQDGKEMKEFSPLDTAMLLRNAERVIVVPGYGLAVSQGQRAVREIADVLKQQGTQVVYAVHPVAGRMPGHMNVLLAEADVPYDDLLDLEAVNPEFLHTDVTLIVGANDVVNPAARDDPSSPLAGMPILHADKSRAVIVFKRGKGRGFAGVENPLFTADNAHVVFGDAKQSLTAVASHLKQL